MNAPAKIPSTLDPQTYSLVLSLKDALAEDVSQGPDQLCAASQQLCEHLLSRYREPAGSRVERVALAPWQERKAKAILADNLSSRLLIADVAAQCSLSRSHFSRAFKKTTGRSPQEWLLDLRISSAKDMLSRSALSISHISQECGFADQSHFCRTFNRLVGSPPNSWRRLRGVNAPTCGA